MLVKTYAGSHMELMQNPLPLKTQWRWRLGNTTKMVFDIRQPTR